MLTHWQLWAKAESGDRWHALPCHLLDVAATAEVLWDRLPRSSRVLACRSFGNETIAKKTCVFLAATHDLGKANPYFQSKVSSQHDRLRELGVDLSQYSLGEQVRHGQATGAYLMPWLSERWNWSRLTAQCVALAVGGHHGTFFCDTKQTTLGIGQPPWCDVVQKLLNALSKVLAVETPVEPNPLNPFLGWLSGFVSVADWLGSHNSMTIWQTEETSLAMYLDGARCRAGELLENLNWQVPPTTVSLALGDFLPPGCTPNALQQLTAELPTDVSFAIIEAPTGEGKTEAAFVLTEPARSSGAGVYFALPTMATANGLYGRVEAYLRKATGQDDLETRLLHSQAWLFRENVQTAQDPGDEGREQESRAQDWFAGAKRGLLAPFGVGTIDQALVAALRARHGFVRLFSLAGKTVVIDEVHAYDVYMADLMDVLLGWLRALGCRVILLSATLPNVRRSALLRAWGIEGEPASIAYPSVTWVSGDGHVHSRGFDAKPRKPLTFELIPAGDEEHWTQGAARILDLVRANGGLGALVLNTVRDAQSAYDWLNKHELSGVHLELFHARFTAQDRDVIEKRVLDRFGKYGERTLPAILVATQVVEQSLDLDFDHMVSALAPIDLLIQRAGRLHRHCRNAQGHLRDAGTDQRPDPIVHVLSPPCDETGTPDIVDFVYSHDVLMRTLERLRTNPTITQPSDVADAIEAVYGENDRAAVMSAWEDKLKELEAKTARETQLQKKQAERATIGDVHDDDELIVEATLDLDENDERQVSQLAARTRLENRPSIAVALLRQAGDNLVTVHDADPVNPRDATLACVRISPPYPLWKALLGIDPLDAWRQKGSLSHVRPLILDEGRIELEGYELRYDASRGLDWRKMNAIV